MSTHQTPKDVSAFLDAIREQFPELQVSELKPETRIEELLEWSSLTILLFLAFLSERFEYKLTYAEVKSAGTLGNLFQRLRL